MPIISVIVPVYNVEVYIHRCVDSILTQTFKDFELILVDDGSLDQSGMICEEYAERDGRVSVFHQENKGQAAARNLGIDWVMDNSDSEWICFVDSDDWIHPQYLEALIQAAKSHKSKIASCNIKKTEGNENWVPIVEPSQLVSTSFDYTRGNESIYAYPFMRLFSISLWRNERFPEGRVWEDVATIYKVLFSVNNVAWVNEDLYFYFINPNGTVCAPWTSNRLDEFTAYEEQLSFFSRNDQWSDIYLLLQKLYIKVIRDSFYLEQRSNLPKDQKRYYGRVISQKMRLALKRYGKKSNIRFKENLSVYEVAYPHLMNWYWRFCALKSKILKEKE